MGNTGDQRQEGEAGNTHCDQGSGDSELPVRPGRGAPGFAKEPQKGGVNPRIPAEVRVLGTGPVLSFAMLIQARGRVSLNRDLSSPPAHYPCPAPNSGHKVTLPAGSPEKGP